MQAPLALHVCSSSAGTVSVHTEAIKVLLQHLSLHAVFMHETLQCTLDLMYEDLPTVVHRGCTCVFDAVPMAVAVWPVFTGSSCGH